MGERRLTVISYDIADDRLRERVRILLSRYGERVQYSVFECWLTRPELARLARRLSALIAPDDSVRFYPLCTHCAGRVLAVGAGVTVRRPPRRWFA